MKFILIVLAVHFAGELLSNKQKNRTGNGDDNKQMRSKHPAEYDLR